MRFLVIAMASVLLVPIQVKADSVSYTRDVTPIFNAHCVACHLTGDEHGNLALHPAAARQSLVSVPSRQSALRLVEPRAPDASYLMHKLLGSHLSVGGYGERMPMAKPQLEVDDIEIIRRWVLEGAHEG